MAGLFKKDEPMNLENHLDLKQKTNNIPVAETQLPWLSELHGLSDVTCHSQNTYLKQALSSNPLLALVFLISVRCGPFSIWQYYMDECIKCFFYEL